MNRNNAFAADSLGRFFILTFLLTLPAYALVGLTTRGVILTPKMGFAFVPVATLAPFAAAMILAHRRGGWNEAKTHFLRAFDFKKVTDKRWYVAIILLPPVIMLSALGLASLTGQSLLPIEVPILLAPIAFVALFGGALSEELGWMGHAYDALLLDVWVVRRACGGCTPPGS